MKKRYLVLVVCFIMVFVQVMLTGCDNSQLSKKEKEEDFNQLYNTLKTSFPLFDLQKKKYRIDDWVKNKDKYLKMVKDTKNDREFINVIDSILSNLKQGHTKLLDKKNYDGNKAIYEKIDYINAFKNNNVIERYTNKSKDFDDVENKLNKGVVNDEWNDETKLQDIVPEKIAYMHIYGMKTPEYGGNSELQSIKNYLNNLDKYKAIVIDIRGNGGGDDRFWQSIVPMISNKSFNYKGYILLKNSKFVQDYLKKIVKFSNEKENINDFFIDTKFISKEVYKNISKYDLKKFKYIEQDININSNPVSKFKGNVYLLTDHNVFSSSETMAVFCKETKFATIIGETTGGGGGGGMNPIIFNLKNSGLLVEFQGDTYISQSGVNDDEYRTTPDYVIDNDNGDTTSDAYLNKCINKVKELELIK